MTSPILSADILKLHAQASVQIAKTLEDAVDACHGIQEKLRADVTRVEQIHKAKIVDIDAPR